MKTEDFVQGVRISVIEENTAIYRDLFEHTESATDPYWVRALELYTSLNAEQREVLIEVTRQVSIDAVSSLFAILDGVSQVEGQEDDITIHCGPDELNGELQDRFLEQFES